MAGPPFSLDSKCAQPRVVSAWRLQDLDRPLREFFERLARPSGGSLEDLLGSISADYQEKGSSQADFFQALANLRQIVEIRSATAPEYRYHVGEPQLPGVVIGEPLFIYIDPTCETCKQKLDILNAASASCPSVMPSVVIRVVPSEEENSRDAAAILEIIKTAMPDRYIDAVREFTAVLSVDSSLLADLTKEYLPRGVSDIELREMQARVDALRVRFPWREHGTPLFVYRDRILKRKAIPSSGIAFDPLRNARMLIATLKLIETYDSLATP